MTSSYRIIKSENLLISKEGVQVAKSEPVKKTQSTKLETNNGQKTIHNYGLSPEEKEELLLEYKESLEKNKQSILKQVKEEAEKKSLEEIEKAQEQGFEQGYDQGLQKGYDQALNESTELIEESKEALAHAQREIQEYINREKENIIGLAGAMAETIVNHDIETNSQTMIDMLNPIIQEFRQAGTAIIYCHSKHTRKLKENIFSLKKINADVEYLIMNNPQLGENNFTLEYENQIIDLEIKDQIKSMIQQILDTEV